jgi:serine/threonine protein kinase
VLSQFHILEANPYLRTRIILNIARGSCLSCIVHHHHPSSCDKLGCGSSLLTLKSPVTGMCYLHERVPPILHRDLTPKNLLVRGHSPIVVFEGPIVIASTKTIELQLDRHYTAKVADFGMLARVHPS